MSGGGRRVLLIGLDGADWRLLTPLIDRGAMPVIQRIIERGMSGRLAAPAISQAEVAWLNSLTGAHAHVHGILDPEVHSQDGQSAGQASASDRGAPLVWEIASAAGIACVHAGWGSVIGDSAGASQAPAGEPALPEPELVRSAVERGAVSADPRDVALVDQYRALLIESHRVVQQAIATMRALPSQFVSVRLAAFGRLMNDFARFVPPAPAWVLPRRASAFAAAVEHGCRVHDALIGQLMDAARGDEVTVIIASPRGTPIERLRSDPSSAATATVPNRPAGIVAASGPDVKCDALAFGAAAIDICPTVLALIGCTCPAGVQGRAIPGIGRAGASVALTDGGSSQQSALDITPLPQLAGMSPEAREVACRRAIARAESYAEAGLWRSAAELMRQLADWRPADERVALRCIELMRDAGEVDAALARVTSLPRVSAELIEARALVEASLHAARERHRDALAVLRLERQRQESAGGCGVSAAVHVAHARSELAIGDSVGAARSCELALESDPDCRDAHVVHAHVLYAAERYADAASAGLRAIALAHFDPQMHFLVGTALAALGRARDAVAELLIAVDQDPALVAAYRRLAAVHLRQLGNLDAAQRYAALAGEARMASDRAASASVRSQAARAEDPRHPGQSSR